MTANQDTTSDEFRDISRFAGYRFGNDGSVWTRWEKVRLPGRHSGFVCILGDQWVRLNPRVDKDGYLKITLKEASTGKYLSRGLHRLVLEAFHGPCPEGMECRHLDGDPGNNRPRNLEWSTHQVNAADRRRHGTEQVGARSHRAKLTESEVVEIRRLRASGYRNRVLAEMYGVHKATVTRITCGHSWSET